MIRRFSSLREPLDESFLNARLHGAHGYDRIAGYFSSSIMEVGGEALEGVSGKVRIVCNSELNPRDVATARAAHLAMRREWVASAPERLAEHARDRFGRLYELLRSGKLQVKVLPDHTFGLVHGKAGVITLANGSRTAFLGSVNETRPAWQKNYELLWEDDSAEAVEWVQDEFDALWKHPLAVRLAEFVVQDIGRLAKRRVLASVEQWRAHPEPAPAIVESPVYRQEFGLWQHQKYFVKRAFEAHKTRDGARLLLGDMVGLGKTVQLGFAAMLMGLYGDKPLLVLAPKALLWQWQAELRDLLGFPAAVWDGRQWVDETGIPHPTAGSEGIRRCPRRLGIVSQGLVTSGSDAAEHLKSLRYECVIVDEAHRIRRKNLGPGRENEAPDPNNLLAFMGEIAPRTHSLLLATATPVQLYPVEAWDLLNVLSGGNHTVLGNPWSHWRLSPGEAVRITIGEAMLPEDGYERWSWMRNPLPHAQEGSDFAVLRRALGLSEHEPIAPSDGWDSLRLPDKQRVRRLARDFGRMHNPFIRHIIRRTRDYLENTIDLETGEPYLKPVKVELFGEADDEALALPPYLRDAYAEAEEFCRQLADRAAGAGFLKTLLLRRLGSSIYAGRCTAEGMLHDWEHLPELDVDDDLLPAEAQQLRTLTAQERQILRRFVAMLEANKDRDPKFQAVVDYLVGRRWLERGCIIFSQYYDSVRWLAEELSGGALPDEPIGIYAGSAKSGILLAGVFTPAPREDVKERVRRGELRLLIGTDAASEGLNLQRLGTLINLDLPWNPTRLEQRKGRIQRIGQVADTVFMYNMRYRDSVEDRVHDLLSARLAGIFSLFGQVPDVLEDVWVEVALGRIAEAKQRIGGIPERHPFELKYQQVEAVDWESCATVLDSQARTQALLRGW